jgi:hypothetical protein
VKKWVVALVGAAAVFAAVLLVTPPGFAAIGEVLVGTSRGPNAEGAAYAVGAAATLALAALLGLAAVGLVIDTLRRMAILPHPERSEGSTVDPSPERSEGSASG